MNKELLCKTLDSEIENCETELKIPREELVGFAATDTKIHLVKRVLEMEELKDKLEISK